MKKILIIILSSLLLIILFTYLLGYNNVLYTRTVGKAQQNADRKVFEQSQSYIEGKRQEAIKLYQESTESKDSLDKVSIRNIAAQSFANFDDSNLDEPFKTFIDNCKEGK